MDSETRTPPSSNQSDVLTHVVMDTDLPSDHPPITRQHEAKVDINSSSHENVDFSCASQSKTDGHVADSTDSQVPSSQPSASTDVGQSDSASRMVTSMPSDVPSNHHPVHLDANQSDLENNMTPETQLAPGTEESVSALPTSQSGSSCVTYTEPGEGQGEMKLSTAQDLIKPSSQPPSPSLQTAPAPMSSSSDGIYVDPPTADMLLDSGSSAPSSPTPDKAHSKKAKKKKKHSSRNVSGSKAMKSRGRVHVGVASPLTNQIGPLSTSGQTPSMSQLVSEISVSNTSIGKEGGSRSAVTSGRVSSTQIDTEMMQIDSILRALNMGTFDEGNMATIQQLTDQRPQVECCAFVHGK